MPSCSLCSKSYRSQNSLTRHAHNHRKTNQHQCTECSTVFFRRDLLLRHLKVHNVTDDGAGQDTEVDPPQLQHHPSPSQRASPDYRQRPCQRRRCHTACTSCRKARTKCDGQQPCGTCNMNGVVCEFSKSQHRISETSRSVLRDHNAAAGSETTQRNSETGVECSSGLFSHTQVDTLPEDVSSPRMVSSNYLQSQTVFTAQPPLAYEDLSGVVPSSATNLMAEESPHWIQGVTLDPENGDFDAFDRSHVAESQWPDMTSWPWLHEGMFLQDLDVGQIGDEAQWALRDGIDDVCTQSNQFARHGTVVEDGWLGPVTEHLSLNLSHQPTVQTPSIDAPFRSDCRSHTNSSNSRCNVHARRNSQDIQAELIPRASGQQAAPARPERDTPSQIRLIKELITYAEPSKPSSAAIGDRATYWRSMSLLVERDFLLRADSRLDDHHDHHNHHVLKHFVSQYFQNFSTLWPLLPGFFREYDSLHPILYLTLTSIGAMYCGYRHSHYGKMMHETIRDFLTASHLDYGASDDDLLWLAQSRLLTQVAALYFGQKNGFSCAQHLGAVLVAQARRMDLFSSRDTSNTPRESSKSGLSSPSLHAAACWTRKESRTRLAFGILRAESYTSALLNTRPNVSPEEFDIELPCDDNLWQSESIPHHLVMSIQDSHMDKNYFSDMVRIRLEQEESSLGMSVKSHELLLFGLQDSLWRFCQDPDVFERLVDKEHLEFVPELAGLDFISPATSLSTLCARRNNSRSGTKGFPTHSRHSLDQYLNGPSRRMDDLRRDNIRLVMALKKWKLSLSASCAVSGEGTDRSSLLSSLLLYHLSFLRLYSPVARLHHISYRSLNMREFDKKVVEKVHRWAKTPESEVALQHACIIFSLLQEESRLPSAERARANFLAFVGLHHAAVIVWTLAGLRTDDTMSDGIEVVLEPFEQSKPSIPVKRTCTRDLLVQFVDLFNRITPAWSGRSSFGHVAAQLSQTKFPLN